MRKHLKTYPWTVGKLSLLSLRPLLKERSFKNKFRTLKQEDAMSLAWHRGHNDTYESSIWLDNPDGNRALKKTLRPLWKSIGRWFPNSSDLKNFEITCLNSLTFMSVIYKNSRKRRGSNAEDDISRHANLASWCIDHFCHTSIFFLAEEESLDLPRPMFHGPPAFEAGAFANSATLP